jgi:hypothetical protein
LAIPVTCSCGQDYQLPDSLAGRKIKCKRCGGVVAVPGANPLQAASAPPKSVPPPRLEVPSPVAASAPPEVPEKEKRRKKKSRRGKKRSSYDDYALGDSLEDRLRERSGSERGAAWIRSIKYFAFGVVLIALAAFLFVFFAQWEQEGGIRRLNVIIAFLYKVTGKWGTALIIGGLGLTSCVLGILNALGIFVVVETED